MKKLCVALYCVVTLVLVAFFNVVSVPTWLGWMSLLYIPAHLALLFYILSR